VQLVREHDEDRIRSACYSSPRPASASNVAHDLLQGGIYSTQKRDTIPLATPSRIRAAPRGALSKAIRRFAETGTRGARVSNLRVPRMIRVLDLSAIPFFFLASKTAGCRGSDRLIAVLQYDTHAMDCSRILCRSHDAIPARVTNYPLPRPLELDLLTHIRPRVIHRARVCTSACRWKPRDEARWKTDRSSFAFRCVSRSDRACIANARSLVA